MTCFEPLTMYKPRYAQLDIPANDYYKLKKLSFKPSEFREKIQVPCGHCIGCRLDHASMWQTRIMMEAQNWKKTCFITLTYNNKHLPMKYKNIPWIKEKTQLNKKHLQDFFKRLRYFHEGFQEWKNPKTGKIEKPLRYYASGEYGHEGTRAEIGGNPHYHICLFNWQPTDLKFYKLNDLGFPIYKSKELQKIWGMGFVTVEELNYETAGYVARYVQKKAGIEAQKREYTGEIATELRIDERNGNLYEHTIRRQKIIKGVQEPEFQVMSRAVGIGRLYWNKYKDKIKRNSGIYFKVHEKTVLKPIPRYFKKLWEDENYEEYYRWKYVQTQNGIKKKVEIINKYKLNNIQDEEIIFQFYLDTKKRILLQKANSLKRNRFV